MGKMTRHETFIEFVNAKIEFAKTETERQGWIIAKHLVEKDLEVLEIIKNKKVQVGLITMTKYCDNYNFIVSRHKRLTEEEFEKIKEWLERDKEK